jgi:hypothetical protein
MASSVALRDFAKGTLSLLFSVLVMDAFSRMLSRDGWGLSFWLLSRQSQQSPLKISHMLFADDTLIMCDADVDQIRNLDHILVFRGHFGVKG